MVTHFLKPESFRPAGGPAFDLVGMTNEVGAPSFAYSAKGGNHVRVGDRVCAECERAVSAASYPPLQNTQGRGTRTIDGVNNN